MGRLIDADALIEAMRKYEKEAEEAMTCPGWWAAYNVIEKQPTAYDVEKVMAELEEYKKQWMDSDYLNGVDEIIDIVKRGGVE